MCVWNKMQRQPEKPAEFSEGFIGEENINIFAINFHIFNIDRSDPVSNRFHFIVFPCRFSNIHPFSSTISDTVSFLLNVVFFFSSSLGKITYFFSLERIFFFDLRSKRVPKLVK